MFLKADLHVHTKFSGLTKYKYLVFLDSVEEPKNVLKYAKKRGIDIVAITDHNTIRGGLEAKKLSKEYGVEVIVGSEIRTNEGEIIGIFLNEEIKEGLSAEETIELIHDQGGLALAPHPYSPLLNSLKDRIMSLDIDGIEVFNAYHRDGIANSIALQKALKMNKALIGASDAHCARMVGYGYTIFKGSCAEDLYYAIKKAKTSFGGRKTPLIDVFLWSYKVVYKSELKLVKEDVEPRKKFLLMLSGLIFMTTPFSIVANIFGDIYLRWKAKKLKNLLHSF